MYQCQCQWLLYFGFRFVNINNHYFFIVSKIQLYAISIINSTEPSRPPIPRTANAEPKWDMFRTSGGCGGSSRNIYINKKNVIAESQYSSTFTLLLYISSIHLFQNPPACRLSITQSSCSFREKVFLCGICWQITSQIQTKPKEQYHKNGNCLLCIHFLKRSKRAKQYVKAIPFQDNQL